MEAVTVHVVADEQAPKTASSLSIADKDPPSEGAVKPCSSSWQGLLLVLGGVLVYFPSFGQANAFGIFQAYYQEHLLAGCSSDQIAWIGALQIFLISIGATIVGPLFDTYGARSLQISGIVLHFLSLVLTSLSREYYQILLAHGILFGIANCLVAFPALTAVSQALDRHTGLAVGSMYAAASVGGIFWTEIWGLLLVHVGFGWAMRATAFISLGFLLPGSCLVASRCADSQKQTVSRSLQEFVSCAKDVPYILLAVGGMLTNCGVAVPTFFLVLFGLENGLDEGHANRLVTWINLGSFAGLLVTGALADKLGWFNLLSFSALICAVLVYCLQAIKNEAGTIVFSIVFGVFSGCILSLQAACVAHISPNRSGLGARLGLANAIGSVSVLTGGPIAGSLLARDHGDFSHAISFGGSVIMAGTVLIVASRILAGPKRWRV